MQFVSTIALSVNGEQHQLLVDHRRTLLSLLREQLGLTGAKTGCDHGQCGACTVLLDGQRVNSCLILAVAVDGSQVTTVEGLAEGDRLHPLQEAFIAQDAFQCGFCTAGQLCSAVGMLKELAGGRPSAVTDPAGTGDPVASEEEIRERLSGNLCRCGAYPGIVRAVQEVAR